MKILKSVIVLIFLLIFGVGINAQEQRIIRDVVLLDREPFEVLMSGTGDIVYKVKHLPNYLKSAEEIKKIKTDGNELASTFPVQAVERIENSEEKDEISTNAIASDQKTEESEVEKVVANHPPSRIIKADPETKSFKEYYEIEFLPGTATLSAASITTLNELATFLNANPENHVQVFGFQNESPIVALLLSQRRRDACIAYLKIKGVKVGLQVSKGSITKGTNNKIVFGLE